MSKIFTIGTFRRSKRTLEEQARKWGGDTRQLEKDLDAIKLDILAHRDNEAINKLNIVIYNLQMTSSHLNDCLTAINQQDYVTAALDLEDAINIVEQNF